MSQTTFLIYYLDISMIVSSLEMILNRPSYLINVRGGSICNENPFITPFTNALGFNAICQTKDRSVAGIMMHEKLFYLSKFNKLQTF